MQRPINEDIHPRKTVDTNYRTGKVKSIDVSSKHKEATSKVDKLQTLLKIGVLDKDVLDYLPGMQQMSYQVVIYSVHTKESTLV